MSLTLPIKACPGGLVPPSWKVVHRECLKTCSYTVNSAKPWPVTSGQTGYCSPVSSLGPPPSTLTGVTGVKSGHGHMSRAGWEGQQGRGLLREEGASFFPGLPKPAPWTEPWQQWGSAPWPALAARTPGVRSQHQGQKTAARTPIAIQHQGQSLRQRNWRPGTALDSPLGL